MTLDTCYRKYNSSKARAEIIVLSSLNHGCSLDCEATRASNSSEVISRHIYTWEHVEENWLSYVSHGPADGLPRFSQLERSVLFHVAAPGPWLPNVHTREP
jgi:hypothetical protein